MAAFQYGDRVKSTYLGFGLDISQSVVTVTTPDGRPLGTERTLIGARKLIKGYRNTDKQSRRHSREERADGSNKKGR